MQTRKPDTTNSAAILITVSHPLALVPPAHPSVDLHAHRVKEQVVAAAAAVVVVVVDFMKTKSRRRSCSTGSLVVVD
jgi:hypothetical protein